jgi:hypothetical protein
MTSKRDFQRYRQELIMRLRNAFVILAVFGFLCAPAGADELTPQKRADIEHLLQMTGALSIGKQMATVVATNFTQSLKKVRPDIPQRALDLLPGEIAAVFEENTASFKESVIPIYDRYFTDAELKQLIQFYSTDVGQKAIKVLPGLMRDAMAAGQQWGQSLGPEINRRIAAKLKQQGVKL